MVIVVSNLNLPKLKASIGSHDHKPLPALRLLAPKPSQHPRTIARPGAPLYRPACVHVAPSNLAKHPDTPVGIQARRPLDLLIFPLPPWRGFVNICPHTPTPTTPPKNEFFFSFDTFYERKRRKMYDVGRFAALKGSTDTIDLRLMDIPSPKTTAMKSLTESMIVLIFRE